MLEAGPVTAASEVGGVRVEPTDTVAGGSQLRSSKPGARHAVSAAVTLQSSIQPYRQYREREREREQRRELEGQEFLIPICFGLGARKEIITLEGRRRLT